MKSPQQHQKRVEKMLEYSQNQKNGNNRKNRISVEERNCALQLARYL
jgi:hypothetical protein